MAKEINNFWKTYLENDDDSIEETREYLKKSGIDIEKVRNEFSELLDKLGEEIKREDARNKMKEGKAKQDAFNKQIRFEDTYIREGTNTNYQNCQLQYREGNEKSKEEKKQDEERDKAAMEVLKKINRERR
jgi:hypothetical protein